jgi:hypothetical protein
LISVGTGAAPSLDPDTGGKYHWSNLIDLPSALMYGALVDQDINCRTFGRCVYGAPIDQEIGDLIPRDGRGDLIPVATDLGRAFLYTRYNADLSRDGLAALGLPEIDPALVQKLDSVDCIDDLGRVGRRLAEEVSVEHFGPFVGK